MDSIPSSPSVKKLKQTQLPFLLNKGSLKTSTEDKENISTSSFKNANVPAEDGGKFQNVCDTPVVDLTHSDTSQDEESGATRESGAGIKSSKKRRRRTASPNVSTSKRAVLSHDVPKSTQNKIPDGKPQDTSQNVPEIHIIPPTPVGQKSKLSDFYAPVVAKSPKSNVTVEEIQSGKAAKPAIIASVEAEREKAHSKEKHKYPPLSSILCRKRTRSQSPPRDNDTMKDGVRDEKNKKMDLASQASPEKLDKTQDVDSLCPNKSRSNLGAAQENCKADFEETKIPASLSDVIPEDAEDSGDKNDDDAMPNPDEISEISLCTDSIAKVDANPAVIFESDEENDGRKPEASYPVVNAEMEPETVETSDMTSSSDKIINSVQASDSSDVVVSADRTPETRKILDITPNLDETNTSYEQDTDGAANLELDDHLEIQETSESVESHKKSNSKEEDLSDHDQVEKELDNDGNFRGFNGGRNTVESDETPQLLLIPHSPIPCDEIDSDDNKLDGDPIVLIEDISDQIPTRKSQRCQQKRKVASVTPEDTTKVKKKSRRSIEADFKRQQKEKEKQERMKLREEQRLAKEKEKIELQKKKEEEKVRKEEERRRKREEEEAAKAERFRIKEEERKKKREEEEAAKAERLRKLEEKKKEKEVLEMARKIEKERKDEEKKKEKEKKELERLRIEKEKQLAEEEKRKKDEKRAEAFKSFFRSPGRSPSAKKSADKIGIFVPFQRKQDMFLAPIHRRILTETQKTAFECVLHMEDAVSSDYLKEIAKRKRIVFAPTIPKSQEKYISLEEDGLEIINGNNLGVEPLRAKFLSFHANYRPPYYGTWRKKSNILSYKNPFKKDNDIFDYEFDSDDEWEEPADGEDIDHSDGEDEGEGNEEDEDDGFFVPHGYLSDDEGVGEEGEEAGMKPDHKLKQKQLEFEASFKRKLSALTPVVIGCAWKDSAVALEKVHQEILDSYKPEFMCKLPISISPQSNAVENEKDTPTEANKSDSSKAKNKFSVPDEAMPDLIRLLHGNPLGLGRIVTEFQSYWRLKNADGETTYGPISLDEGSECQEKDDCQSEINVSHSEVNQQSLPTAVESTPKRGSMENEISKGKLRSKCKEIATYTRKENMNRSCWFVHEAILKEYGLEDGGAPVPCRWKYATDVPKVQVLMFPQSEKATSAIAPTNPATPKQDAMNSITRFASIVSPDTILGLSKLKHDKEKSTQQSSASSISKYATEKISPCVIIEKSAQKIDEEKLQRAKECVVEKTAPVVPQEGIYVIPSREAVKTFFKINETDNEAGETSK